MKKICLISIVMFCSIFSSTLFAQTSCRKIQSKINKSWKLWDTKRDMAQKILKTSFNEAIVWTNKKYLDSVRETGFFLAAQCLSPELIAEVELITDTYLNMFPQGKYRKQMLIRKALVCFAENKFAQGNQALAMAEEASKNRMSYPQKTMRLSGLMTSGHFRSAEKYLEGNYASRKNRKLKKDLRRFHLGNRYMKSLVAKVKSGKVSGEVAIKKIEEGLNIASFAKQSPEADLIAIKLRDNKNLSYYSREITWCGLSRVVHHSMATNLRLTRYENFIENFPECTATEKYKALQQIRNIYLYELNSKPKADRVLAKMKLIKGYEYRAMAEQLLTSLTEDKIITAHGNETLNKLYKMSNIFPYDNGSLPVIKIEHINLMLAISDMATGQSSGLKKIAKTEGYGKIPVELLYWGAVDKKDKSWEVYSSSKNSFDNKSIRMIEDVLFPLYLPAEDGDRMFLAGLAAANKFPYLGMELIRMSLTTKPRVRKNEHALAVLADLYQEHMAYGEAQQIWAQLRTLHPQSVWLK